MIPVVVGVDPGEFESAIVALTPAASGRVAVFASGMIPATPEAAEAWLRLVATKGARIDAVGIERAEGAIFDKFRAAHLLVAQDV